jgi:hypothetical protein
VPRLEEAILITQEVPKKILTGTRFSHLRTGDSKAENAPKIDLRYEALAAMAEDLELLSLSLGSSLGDEPIAGKEFLRLRSLQERVGILCSAVPSPLDKCESLSSTQRAALSSIPKSIAHISGMQP